MADEQNSVVNKQHFKLTSRGVPRTAVHPTGISQAFLDGIKPPTALCYPYRVLKLHYSVPTGYCEKLTVILLVPG